MVKSTINYYEKNASEFIETSLHADMTKMYEAFLRYIPEYGSILDAGCGSGRDSKFFCDKGYEVMAFDAAETMCTYASKLIGQPVQNMTFDEVDFQNKFDGVWACASLLHISRTHVLQIIDKLIEALVPGGVMYASWKSGAGERMSGERFFCDFNEESIRQLMQENNGIEILNIWTTGDVRADRINEYWVNVLLRKMFDDAEVMRDD